MNRNLQIMSASIVTLLLVVGLVPAAAARPVGIPVPTGQERPARGEAAPDPGPLQPRGATQAFPRAVVPDPMVESIMAQVAAADVLYYNRELVGEVPVWVDGEWYTITTRYTYSGTPI